MDDDYHIIHNTIAKCICLIVTDVKYEYLKPKIVSIFTPIILEKAEGKDRASSEIMTRLCDNVKTLCRKDFEKFVAAIRVEHPHVARKIDDEYLRQQNQCKVRQTSGNHRHRSSRLVPNQMSRRNQPNQGNSVGSTQPQVPVIEERPVVACQYDERHQSSYNTGQNSGNEQNAASLSSATTNQMKRDGRGSASTASLSGPTSLPSVASSSDQENLSSRSSSSEQGTAAPAASTDQSVYAKERTRDPDDVYKMESHPRGLAFIIANEKFENKLKNRPGTQADIYYLQEMFAYLNFSVEVKRDLRSEQMKDQLVNWSNDQRLKNVDALAVAILTHGNKEDGLIGTESNSAILYKSEIIKIFSTGREGSLMKGKPKFFIIQACRGDAEHLEETSPPQRDPNSGLRYDSGDDVESFDCDSNTFNNDPETVADGLGDRPRASTADMCFLHSSSLGFKSYRKTTSGSPVVKKLTEFIKAHAHEEEFTAILRKLLRYFAQTPIDSRYFTMPTSDFLLTCKWYFNPPIQSPSDH